MPEIKKIPFNFRELIVQQYSTKDLLSDGDEFDMHRSFDSWAEYFQARLYKVKKYWKHWKLSYEKMAKKIPITVIEHFLPMLMEDLIKNEVEFVVNPRCKTPNQFVFKAGYIDRRRKRRYRWRYIIAAHGKHYLMRMHFPKDWKCKQIKRYCYMDPHYRSVMNKEIKKGKQYYNSTKEKLLSQL